MVVVVVVLFTATVELLKLVDTETVVVAVIASEAGATVDTVEPNDVVVSTSGAAVVGDSTPASSPACVVGVVVTSPSATCAAFNFGRDPIAVALATG